MIIIFASKFHQEKSNNVYKQQVGISQSKSQVFLKALVINLTVTKIFSWKMIDSSGSQAKLRNQKSVIMNNLYFMLVFMFALAILLASVFTPLVKNTLNFEG